MNLRGNGLSLFLHIATGLLALGSIITHVIDGNYDVAWQANALIYVCLSATFMLQVVGYQNMIENANEKAIKMLEDAIEQKKKFDKKHSTKTEK